jgi:hypothetical protein
LYVRVLHDIWSLLVVIILTAYVFEHVFVKSDNNACGKYVQEPKFVYTVELDIEECLKQNPGINLFLSKLRAKPARLEFSKTPWAPLDVISALARQGESLSTSTGLAVESVDHLQGHDLEQRGTSNASTTGRRPGEFSSIYEHPKGFVCTHWNEVKARMVILVVLTAKWVENLRLV